MRPWQRSRTVSFLIALGLGTLLLAGQQALSPPGDWPMLGRTPARLPMQPKAMKLPAEWDIKTGKNVVWSVPVGSQSYGGPVVANGKIFVGTNNGGLRDPTVPGDRGILMCFRESDGKFLWQAVHDKLAEGRVHDWPDQGVASTPYVEADRLYYLSNRCELICADIEGMANGNQGSQHEAYRGLYDADILWRLDLMKELGVRPHNLAASSPLVRGDLVFVVTGNGHDESHEFIPAPQAPSFVAVDKRTGKVRWTDNSPGKAILHGQWGSPTWLEQGRGQVLMPGGDGWLRAFDAATGELVWKFDCNPKASVFKLGGKGTRNELIAAPVVHEGRVYIATGQDPEHGDGVGHLWCIDPTGKRGDISPRGDNFDPAARVNQGSGLVWHFGGSYTIVQDGKPQEELRFQRSLSMCGIADGLLFVTTFSGYVYCLDAQTGQQYWVYDLYCSLWGSPLIADGKVYVGTEEGDVVVFEARRQCRKVAVNEMVRAICNAGPIAANNRLYILTKSHLYALAEQGKPE
jgi:outer membrane protein assembly factor BamB